MALDAEFKVLFLEKARRDEKWDLYAQLGFKYLSPAQKELVVDLLRSAGPDLMRRDLTDEKEKKLVAFLRKCDAVGCYNPDACAERAEEFDFDPMQERAGMALDAEFKVLFLEKARCDVNWDLYAQLGFEYLSPAQKELVVELLRSAGPDLMRRDLTDETVPKVEPKTNLQSKPGSLLRPQEAALRIQPPRPGHCGCCIA